jgi:hypothetical protein
VLIIGCSVMISLRHQESVSAATKCSEGTTLSVVLIKPSHYDDDGYVIRWWRAMTPSNALAAVYGIRLRRTAGAGTGCRHLRPCGHSPSPTAGRF